MGDDGLGVHVARALAESGALAPSDEVIDGGTALFDLGARVAGHDEVVIVDAIRGDGEPGTVYRIDNATELLELEADAPPLSLHDWTAMEMLRSLRMVGIEIPRLMLIGVEPERIAPSTELSPSVQAAVARIVLANTWAARPLASRLDPTLKPNQPTHSSEVPIITIGRLWGWKEEPLLFQQKHRSISCLKRPELGYGDIGRISPPSGPVEADAAEQVEIQVKYEGYIERQMDQVERFAGMEQKALPEDMDYDSITGLGSEVKQKLTQVRPVSLGQASRISGITPAAISLLMVALEKRKRGRTAE